MGAQFTIPLITVIPGQLIASSLYNNEWNNLNVNFVPAGMDSYSDTDAQMQIQTNPFPGSVTSHASNLGGEIERIRYQLAQILGTSFWYNAPAASIATAVNSLVPLGGVIDYPVATAPNANYHLADGTAIDRVIYAGLFTLIGTTFGIGDGSTSFNLPNYTDKLSIAAGNLYAIATTGGAVSQAIGLTNLPASTVSVNITDPGHNHIQNAHNHSASDSGHTHVETVNTYSGSNGTPSGATVPGAGNASGVAVIPTKVIINPQADTNNTATQSGSANISIGSTTPTNNSNTTGITASTANLGSGTALPILNPYLAMYKMIRVL